MDLIFYEKNCYTSHPDYTASDIVSIYDAMACKYDASTGTLSFTLPDVVFRFLKVVAIRGDVEDSLKSIFPLQVADKHVSIVLTENQKANLTGFRFEAIFDTTISYDADATTYIAGEIIGEFSYPTGRVNISALPATTVGFSGQREGKDFSHVQILVSAIRGDEVGGPGYVWESPFYPKDIDTLVTLSEVVPLCEGQDITKLNVLYYFVQENAEGGFDFVRAYIVGDITTVPTFEVTHKQLPLVSLDLHEDKAYCLEPVLLTINRRENRIVKNVTIDVQGYRAHFEFFEDRNLLSIDLSEYLKALWALVDVFEFQQLQTTVVVKLYNSEWEQLETQGVTITTIYGKKPDPVISGPEIRVQWLDKYGLLHDEKFRLVDNQTEGASEQKYVVKGEERENKTGEKSITLAKVLANHAEREVFKTIVFADHVRAFIGDAWKRVKVANSYKTGEGREKKNFEFTIKYVL